MTIGLLTMLLSYHQLVGRHLLASDFSADLATAHLLLTGHNPYANPAAGPGYAYPFNAQNPHGLPGMVLAIPFTFLPPSLAGGLFEGISAGLLAFALTRQGWLRLTLLLSPSFFVALSVGQWSPVVMAAALWPDLLLVGLAKPNLLVATGPFYGSRRGWLLTILFTGVTLIVWPRWPLQWLAVVSHEPGGRYLAPLTILPLLLLALIKWKTRRARFFLVFSAIPQHGFFYDQLLLWLLPRNVWQGLVLSGFGWFGYLLWFALHGGNPALALTSNGPSAIWLVPWFFVPALAVVLWPAAKRERQLAPGLRTEHALPPAG